MYDEECGCEPGIERLRLNRLSYMQGQIAKFGVRGENGGFAICMR